MFNRSVNLEPEKIKATGCLKNLLIWKHFSSVGAKWVWCLIEGILALNQRSYSLSWIFDNLGVCVLLVLHLSVIFLTIPLWIIFCRFSSEHVCVCMYACTINSYLLLYHFIWNESDSPIYPFLLLPFLYLPYVFFSSRYHHILNPKLQFHDFF